MKRREFIASSGAAAALACADTALAAPAAQGDAALKTALQALFDDDVRASPEDATSLGLDKGRLAPLKSQLNPRGANRRKRELARTRAWIRRVRGFDPARLSDSARLWREQVLYDLEQKTVAPGRFGIDSVQRPYPLSQRGGAYFELPDFLDSQHTIETTADAGAYLARLDAFAAAIDQDTAEQKAQARRGFVAPVWALDLALGQMNKLRGAQAEGSGLVQSLARRAADKGIAGDWQARAASIVNRRVYPALDRQIALVEGLRKTSPAGDGAWRLPRGDDIYAAALAQATTTTMTPDEVHRVGLQQVAEISVKLDGILRGAGLTRGAVGERLAALNVRPEQLYPDSAAGRRALIADLNAGVKAMYARLPQAFSTIPQQPLEIRSVPVEIQDGASNGYYNRAALDGSRPAIYWINLKSVGDWPKYSLPALTYHEGVPGHHLQGGIAQLAGDVPMVIRNNFISAYGEGWALYSEQLADELGGFSGIERAGYLQSFLFRAARLVVDTGIHAKRWSREQAAAYMRETTGFAANRSLSEVQRYCTQIGQACSYKIGHNVWEKARARAQAALGPRFDLKWFHDVLADGVMPLSMLDARIDARVAERLKTMG